MPIYEYECTNCHRLFEKIQKISDPPQQDCVFCSQATAVRLVSASRFQLKGTGWYQTDYKDGAKGATAKGSTAKDGSAAASNSIDHKQADQKQTGKLQPEKNEGKQKNEVTEKKATGVTSTQE